MRAHEPEGRSESAARRSASAGTSPARVRGPAPRLQRRGFLGHADEEPVQERSGVAGPPRRVGGRRLMAGVLQRLAVPGQRRGPRRRLDAERLAWPVTPIRSGRPGSATDR